MTGIADLISKGGIIMAPIFICSIVAMAIVIERYVFYRKYFVDVEFFFKPILKLVGDGNTSKIMDWHRENNNIITLVGSHKEISVPYGVLKFKDGVLDMIDEKPKFDLFINAGTYILEPKIFEWIQDGEFLNMDHLIAKVIKKCPKKVGVFPHWEGWFDIGQWEEYQKSLEKIRAR